MIAAAAYRDEQRLRVAQLTAWRTAELSRRKSIPQFEKLLGEKAGPKKPQSVEQHAGILRLLHAQLGGTLIVGSGKEARA